MDLTPVRVKGRPGKYAVQIRVTHPYRCGCYFCSDRPRRGFARWELGYSITTTYPSPFPHSAEDTLAFGERVYASSRAWAMARARECQIAATAAPPENQMCDVPPILGARPAAPRVPSVQFGSDESNEVVYFILHPEKPISVKIGRTVDIKKRFRILHQGTPVKLIYLGCTPGGHELEHGLHVECAEARIHGEWFRLTHEVTRVVERSIGRKLNDLLTVNWAAIVATDRAGWKDVVVEKGELRILNYGRGTDA